MFLSQQEKHTIKSRCIRNTKELKSKSVRLAIANVID